MKTTASVLKGGHQTKSLTKLKRTEDYYFRTEILGELNLPKACSYILKVGQSRSSWSWTILRCNQRYMELVLAQSQSKEFLVQAFLIYNNHTCV